MQEHEFTNRVRSLFNIDGYLLPELSETEQETFVRDPVRFYIRCDDSTRIAIWREIDKRQKERA